MTSRQWPPLLGGHLSSHDQGSINLLKSLPKGGCLIGLRKTKKNHKNFWLLTQATQAIHIRSNYHIQEPINGKNTYILLTKREGRNGRNLARGPRADILPVRSRASLVNKRFITRLKTIV